MMSLPQIQDARPFLAQESITKMADFFHRYVVKNAGFKLLALLMAVGLWLAVARSPAALHSRSWL